MAKRIHKLDKVLRKTLGKLDLTVKLEGYRVWPLWDDIVGGQIAKRAQPDKLRNRILFVRVSNSVWMQELQTMKPMLLERIRKAVKKAPIDDIRFRLGEVPSPPTSPAPPPTTAEIEASSLSPDLEAHLERVRDSELRDLLRNAMLKQARRAAKRDQGA